MHCLGDTDVAYLVSGCEFWFLMCTLLVTQTVACFVSVGELAWFLMSTLLVTQMWSVFFQTVSLIFNVHSSGDTDVACLFQKVSWPVFFNVHSSGDTDVACLVLEGELAWL